MSRLAVLTFGIFHNDVENGLLQSFYDRGPAVFSTADRVPGYIQLVADKNNHEEPRSTYLNANDIIGTSEVLTLWTHLEPLFAFVYNGLHASALNKRTQWFVKGVFPPYVLWWVEDDHAPDWHEAYERLEHLHQKGSTAFAFDFKHPFDADGNAVQIDREVAKSIAQSLNLR